MEVDSLDILRLEQAAKRMRSAIESIPPEMLPAPMRSFPRNACGDTSLLLGTYLCDLGIRKFQFVSGTLKNYNVSYVSHAWLQYENMIIDITADQFSDAPLGEVLFLSSTWHMKFDINYRRESDFRAWSEYDVDHYLYDVYNMINLCLFDQP